MRVVDMKINMDLLLGMSIWPLGLHVVGSGLHANAPLAVCVDSGMEPLVREHPAIGVKVGCVEYDYVSNNPHSFAPLEPGAVPGRVVVETTESAHCGDWYARVKARRSRSAVAALPRRVAQNAVVSDGSVVGVLDIDFAAPGRPLWGLALTA
jgi:hypothetical protein